MKRWLLLLIALVIAVSALAVRSSARATARRKREIGYQVGLSTYSKALHLGITRKELEDYLRLNNTNFASVFTAYGGRRESQWADVVKIGEESSPWYCSEAYVYVAFEFSGAEQFKRNDSDVLEKIELFRPYTGCL
jgi:hypothetical protein